MEKLIQNFKEGNLQEIQEEMSRLVKENLRLFVKDSFIRESAQESEIVYPKTISITGGQYLFNTRLITTDNSVIDETLFQFSTELAKMICKTSEYVYRGVLCGQEGKFGIDFTQYIYPFTSQTLYSYSPHDSSMNIIVDYLKYDFIKLVYQDSEYHAMYSIVTENTSDTTYPDYPLIMYHPSILYFKDITDSVNITVTEKDDDYIIHVKKICEFAFTDKLNKETLILCKQEDH